MNGLSNLRDTFRECSLTTTDDPIRFWRLKVKGQGHSRPSSGEVRLVIVEKYSKNSTRTKRFNSDTGR